MEKLFQEKVEEKKAIPDFYNAVVAVNDYFNFSSVEELLTNWRFIKIIMESYETSVPASNGNDELLMKYKPIQSEEDIEIAKFIMIELYNE